MSEQSGRRAFLRSFAALSASGVLAALAPAPLAAQPPVAIERVVPAVWADEWPPTAVAGRLVACQEAPGHYTTDGMPALFYGATPGKNAAGECCGVSGFPVEREIVPPEGMHVREYKVTGPDGGRGRYAVVRHTGD